jgi:N-acyl-D-amino-acid deacylase
LRFTITLPIIRSMMMISIRTLLLAGFLPVALTACESEPLPSADPATQLITNVLLIDGSGAPQRAEAVRILGGKIIDVGELKARSGDIVIDGAGLVLAPGFIDTHSHADEELFEQPDALAAVSQGITSVVIGQDGGSPFPLFDFRLKMLDQPVAINVAAYSGHNTLRRHVLGESYQREASEPEISVMSQFLREDMQAGALGLAAGLEYDPGIYSSTEEVVALAKVAAGYGGRYISHVRSEDRWFEQAIDEIIDIGRSANIPVQVSHIKLALTSLWGRAPEILLKMDAARAEGIDITADIYPYEYWQSGMMVLLPERDISDRAEVEFALSDLAPPEGLWFTQFDPQPEYVGKTLVEVAQLRGVDPVTAFMDLIAESEAMAAQTGEGADTIIGTSMREEDIKILMAWPHTNICTDGSLEDLHPRGAGTFPRVLGRYVRELGLMSLEEAVHKMTGLSAQHMGFADRGIIRPGAVADLVLFDPDTVIDHATPQEPGALSSGISKVWVNGHIVFENGQETGLRPGRFIPRANNSVEEP